MSLDERATVIIPFVAAMVLTPLLISWLARKIPRNATTQTTAPSKHKFRNQMIGFASFCFLVLGGELPLLIQGKSAIPPTWQNIALILSCAALGAVGGTALVANLLGDQGARDHLEYWEQQTGIAASGVLLLSKLIVSAALIALAAALLFSFV